MRIFHTQTVAKSRKRRQCDWCGEAIEIGQPYESYRWARPGDSGTVRQHPECILAMQKMAEQEGWEFEWSPGDFKRGSINER